MTALREQPPAVRRLVLRRVAGDRPVPDSVIDVSERGTKSIELGDGLRAVAEYGTLRFTRARETEAPEPVELTVPGRVGFGGWEVEAALGVPGDVSVRADLLGVTHRAGWREGDGWPDWLAGQVPEGPVHRPPVPRELRRTLAVVEAHGEIVGWPAWPSTSASPRLRGRRTRWA